MYSFLTTNRKWAGGIMRAGEKGEKSHSDYKGIPIPVVKKRGQTWQWKQTYNEAFVPKLLGSHTRNRGTWAGGDWLGQGKSERLMFVKRKQNWLVCFKKGWEDKSKKKAACYCRIHPLTSETLKDPDRDLQPALAGTEYEAENTQMPRGSFCGAREAALRLHRVMVRAVFFQQVCYCWVSHRAGHCRP